MKRWNVSSGQRREGTVLLPGFDDEEVDWLSLVLCSDQFDTQGLATLLFALLCSFIPSTYTVESIVHVQV